MNKHKQSWEKWFLMLNEYTEDYGHANVPIRYETQNGNRLGIWVQNQRSQYKKGKLSKEQIQKLESFDGWTWAKYNQSQSFEEWILILKEYTNKHGHANVPNIYETENGNRLGQWVKIQREKYKKGILSKKQIQKLESFDGWTWAKHQSFEEWLLILKEYVEDHGNAIVPKNYETENGNRLGQWVKTQRQKYKKEKLSVEYIEKLEALPHWLWYASEYKSLNERRPPEEPPFEPNY